MQEIPKRIRENCIFLRKIRISHRKYVSFVIANTGWLYELLDGNIINSIKLAAKLHGKIRLQTVQPPNGDLFYFILNEQQLYQVQRDTELRVVDVFSDVTSMSVEDALGEPKIKINHSKSSCKVLDFSRPQAGHLDNYMKEILSRVEEIKLEAKCELETETETYMERLHAEAERRKFLPRELRCEEPGEKCPLILYGSYWRKVHNDCLVVGFPVLNNSNTRPLTVSSIDGIVLSDELKDFEFKVALFKCEKDFYSLDRLKDHVAANDDGLLGGSGDNDDEEDQCGKIPEYDDEWKFNEKRVLHTQQSGVVVITINLMHFIDSPVYNLNCFITYNVVAPQTQIELQLHAGKLMFRAKELFTDTLWLPFNTETAYIDLLAATATSLHITVSITYENPPKRDILEFFTQSMKFESLTETYESVGDSCKRLKLEANCHLLYVREGFLKQSLVRLKVLSRKKHELKLYALNENQILALFRAIQSKYEENVRITLKEPAKDWLRMKLQEGITAEIMNLLQPEFDVRKQVELEAETDKFYQATRNKSLYI